ncbi:MAG: hypothetical protein HQL97_01470 [Magnetococcales bacterium]|nr:hypothetical protein [Magnetococcales bacterium]
MSLPFRFMGQDNKCGQHIPDHHIGGISPLLGQIGCHSYPFLQNLGALMAHEPFGIARQGFHRCRKSDIRQFSGSDFVHSMGRFAFRIGGFNSGTDAVLFFQGDATPGGFVKYPATWLPNLAHDSFPAVCEDAK